jgi:hypothetical protein
MEEPNLLPLDIGASVYVLADVKRARSILEVLPIAELKDRQTVELLDKTDFLAAAIFPQGGSLANAQENSLTSESDGDESSLKSGLRFQIAAWGNYPSFAAGVALNVNKNWKKHRAAAGYSYWHSPASGLSIAITAKQAFAAAASGDPREPVASTGVAPPKGFGEFSRLASIEAASIEVRAPLSCWLENPGPVFTQTLNAAGVPLRFPVQQLFINLYHDASSDQYEALIRMYFENASQARGMAAVLNLAATFSAGASNPLIALFTANPPVPTDNYLDIKTASMNAQELAVLMQMFLRV